MMDTKKDTETEVVAVVAKVALVVAFVLLLVDCFAFLWLFLFPHHVLGVSRFYFSPGSPSSSSPFSSSP